MQTLCQILFAVDVHFYERAFGNEAVCRRPFNDAIKTVISEILVRLYPNGLPTDSHLHIAQGLSVNRSDPRRRRTAQLPINNYRKYDYF